MTGSLQIALLGNDPADQQWSLLDYADQLQRALAPHLGPGGRAAVYAPDTRRSWRWLRRWRIGRALATYGSRGLVYPRLLRRCRADLYHILDHGNAGLIRVLDPARTVVSCHDLIPLILPRGGGSLWPWLSTRAVRRALASMGQAAAIVANSACTKRDLVAHLGYPAQRITVIPLGLDPMLRPPADPGGAAAARAVLRLPEGPIVLHVGQTAASKNVEGLLRAVQGLAHRGVRVWLVRAGERLRHRQQRLARQWGIAPRVMDLGPLPRAALRQLYQAADLLVAPSWYEGLGLPPLEAMASGLPAIVSNRGALPETVGEAALIVDPDTDGALAEAMARLLADPALRARQRALGLSRARQFSWPAAAQQLMTVYRAVLEAAA